MSLHLSKGAKYRSQGLYRELQIWKRWYSCCLTGSVPADHDINWDMNHCPLISVHDVSVFIGSCNSEQNLGHGVVWGSAGPDMLRADHRSCLYIVSVPVHALSSRQISSDLSRSANHPSLRVNSNYLGLKACTWVITMMNYAEHWLLRMPEILSSLVCCWSARHGWRPDSGSTDPWAAPVWKAVNPASWIRISVCPLRNTSYCWWGLVTYSYWDFSLFVVLCTFRKSFLCTDPLAVSEVFIGQNAVSLKKVLQPNESYLSPSMTLRGVTESPVLVLGKLRLAQQPGLW